MREIEERTEGDREIRRECRERERTRDLEGERDDSKRERLQRLREVTREIVVCCFGCD